jgi:spermidine/putrescine transport system permease protein
MNRFVTSIVATGYLVLAYVYLFAPVFALMLFSFQTGKVQGLPIEAVTLGWYGAALNNAAFQVGLRTSVAVAVMVSVLSTVLGLASANLLCRHKPAYPLLFAAFVSVPAFVPPILSGLVMLTYFQLIGLNGTIWAIVVAQVCYCSPFAFVALFLAYQRLNPELEQAAVNLGATPHSVLFSIVLPQMHRSVLATLLLTALVSWDEFVLAFFVGGFTKTLPTVIYAAVATSFDPSVNAIGVLVIACSAALLCLSAWLLRPVAVP